MQLVYYYSPDINQCENMNCEQKCNNISGICECDNGFSLNEDNVTCDGKSD